jgi:hypothetical protein
MTELFQRLLRALPRVEQWIDDLHSQSMRQARRASETGYVRLGGYFPSTFLTEARFAIVDTIPFPPVSVYGLPEFQAMAEMPMAGITFGNLYFVHPSHATEGIHFHELVHVVQWRTLGVRPFLLTYALGILQHSYEASPLEAIAFDYQARFDRGLAMPSLVEDVARHAGQTRDLAEAVYRANGINMDA